MTETNTRNSGSVISEQMNRTDLEACHIGQTLGKFTELKRNKRFDNFIMLAGFQGSLFHIAAGSHPVQEAWGSQDSEFELYLPDKHFETITSKIEAFLPV